MSNYIDSLPFNDDMSDIQFVDAAFEELSKNIGFDLAEKVKNDKDGGGDIQKQAKKKIKKACKFDYSKMLLLLMMCSVVRTYYNENVVVYHAMKRILVNSLKSKKVRIGWIALGHGIKFLFISCFVYFIYLLSIYI